MTQYNNNQPLGWDDAIDDIPQDEFVLLPPGEYTFIVENMERKEMTTQKLGTVRVADLSLKFSDETYESYGHINLMLHPKTLWKIREFFKSIGEKVESGKPFAPRWNAVIGSTGKCMVKNGSFVGRDGHKYSTNEVEKFLEPTDAKPAAPATATNNDDFVF
jgi:hypothetical protein